MEFNRLTIKSEITDSPTLKALCESCGESGCSDVCEDYSENHCNGCPVQEAFERLSAYEDTGLSPEKIEKLKQQKDIYKKYWIQQLDAMLAEFDKDGWCRLVMKKEDVLQMKKEMENDYGIFE